MSLSSGYLELNAALKKLRLKWDDARAEWNDPVREQFEQEYWDELEVRVAAALKQMDRLAHVLNKAKQDCS
jgi:hypothetical protein